MCRLPEALPQSCTSYWSIIMGNCTHILDKGVAKGALVGRGNIFDWREDCETEGNKEEGGENLSKLYITPISLWLYNACLYMGGDWIWL
jgi:hypothetical protein